MTPDDDLRKQAVHGFVWAAAQSWGGKILTFILFVILARLISPAEFGVAAAIFLILTAIAIITECGFGDALIQRSELQDADINLPFFVSIGISIGFSTFLLIHAATIEAWMGVPDLAPVIRASALLVPLTTLATFQEALYRRQMMFKSLALRTLFGTMVGGVGACIAALMGWGVFALVLQAYVTAFINMIWLWSKPVWRPSFICIPQSFKAIARFSAPVFGVRVLDFAAVRMADVIVLGLYGTVILGFYTVGIKLLQVVLLLFQSVISDVALSFLSRIADDRPRIAALYMKTVTLSVALLVPILMMMAALAPEISDVMFGQNWATIDQMVRPFLLLGAVQCVQYLNTAYFNAMGRPDYSLLLQGFKIAALVPVFLFSMHEDVFTFVILFCVAQGIAAVPSFYFVTRMLAVRFIDVVQVFVPFLVAAMISFVSVVYAQAAVIIHIPDSFVRGLVLGVVFVSVYGVCVVVIARKQAASVIEFIKTLKAVGSAK